MKIKTILVATDFSVPEIAAIDRARQLAAARRAKLKLVYLPPSGQGNPARKLEDLVVESQGADLVVLPHRRERSTAAFFRGQPVLRILRAAACPVLVTRRAGDAPYDRILVAVDFSPASESLVEFAAGLDVHAQLELFHAISTRGEARLRAAEATERAISAYRERCREHARQRMLTLTDSFDARRNRLLTVLGRGDPGRQTVIQQERSDADLVVVGKASSTAWGDFLCGSVAHRVLSWGSSDVLVVPQAYWQRTAPAASSRIGGSQGQTVPDALQA